MGGWGGGTKKNPEVSADHYKQSSLNQKGKQKKTGNEIEKIPTVTL